jgi:hypothetical protein
VGGGCNTVLRIRQRNLQYGFARGCVRRRKLAAHTCPKVIPPRQNASSVRQLTRRPRHARHSLSRSLPPRSHGPQEWAAFHSECAQLLHEANELDAAQRALAVQLGAVRSKLAELRCVMWPRVEPKDIVHGFRRTLRGGPPPIPPVARGAHPLEGKHLRSTVLAILMRNAIPMSLVEIHRELHLNGYAIASRHPVKRLADSLGYETTRGRARRLDRGIYVIDQLNPGTRRRLGRIELHPARPALTGPG